MRLCVFVLLLFSAVISVVLTPQFAHASDLWATAEPFIVFDETRLPAAAFPETKTPELQPANPSPAMTAITIPGIFKFSGFFDFRYTNFSANEDPLVASSNSESGFGLEDGALYISYEHDRLSVFFDGSFRRAKDGDLSSASTKPQQSQTGRFMFADEKSQLYFRYKISSTLAAQVGQFDTVFGVEYNDSKDRVFGKTGLIYDLTEPVTHTGAMLEYQEDGKFIRAFAANPNNKGSNGSSKTGDDKTEVGASFGYKNEYFRAQVGGMVRSMVRAAGDGNGNRIFTDLTFGTNLDDLTLDFEMSRVDDPSKNTLTAGAGTDHENAGSGFMMLASYRLAPPWLLGFRYEQTIDDPSAMTIKKASAIGGALHYRVSGELELRAEGISYLYEQVGGLKWRDSRISLASLITF